MIFLAGELRNEENILSMIKSGDFDFYAADAGYLPAKRFGVPLRRVLGDFDSAEKPDIDDLLIYPSEKDQTDSELALEHAIQDGYREIWMVAPFGGRLDHSIANLCLLESASLKGVTLKLYDGENLAYLLHQKEHELSQNYRYISFFPWKSNAEISLHGFKYPLGHFNLRLEQPIGVSNEPTDLPRVEVHDGTVLCICVENTREEL